MFVHGKVVAIGIREKVRDNARVEAMLRYIGANESGDEEHSLVYINTFFW